MKELSDFIRQTSGARLTEQEIPIPATIGEGLVFQISGEDFVTLAVRNKDGKRVLKCEITSFVGISAGAQHYYCKCSSLIKNCDVKNHNRWIGGYLGGFEMPDENKSLEFELMRPITKEEMDEDPDRWYGFGHNSRGNEMTYAFVKVEDIYNLIEELKSYFSDEWEIEVVDNYY